jgi:hypothetical protein
MQPLKHITVSFLSRRVLPESESELLYDWRFTANHSVLARTLRDPRPLFFQLNTCGHSPYVTSSLTRGWVCRLQLLLVLASAFILGFKSRGTHDHILLSQIRDSPNLEAHVPVFISPRNRVARLYPQALGSLFVTSYDSQSYGGGIRTRIPTWKIMFPEDRLNISELNSYLTENKTCCILPFNAALGIIHHVLCG